MCVDVCLCACVCLSVCLRTCVCFSCVCLYSCVCTCVCGTNVHVSWACLLAKLCNYVTFMFDSSQQKESIIFCEYGREYCDYGECWLFTGTWKR